MRPLTIIRERETYSGVSQTQRMSITANPSMTVKAAIHQ